MVNRGLDETERGVKCALLVGVGYPGDVRVDEEEDHDEDGHKVHVDEKEDAAVVEAPAFLHAAGGIEHADDSHRQG